MVYIKLNEPIKGCDMIRIKEFHFFDSDNHTATPVSIGFRYQCCSEEGENFYETYNKFISIDDASNFMIPFNNNMKTLYDNICSVLLNYLLSKKIESGTLEVK